MSLMKEASEHGAPAYLLTVRGSVHINQSDFSILYEHVSSFFMKATVHPQRAIDLNVSTSLEFLRLVTPESGGGKSLISRCMTDENLLKTPLLEEIPEEHRPDDQWIAARLRVDNEFRKRMAASIQRKFKRNFQGGMGTGYTTSDEMWCFYKPSDEALQHWINEEGRGEKRIDEDRATASNEERQDTNDTSTDDAEKDESMLRSEDDGTSKDTSSSRIQHESSSKPVRDRYHDDETKDVGSEKTSATVEADGDAPAKTWMGVIPALRHGPGQDQA